MLQCKQNKNNSII